MPLPVGEVLLARDKALKAMEILRGVLGEEVVASVENLVQGNLPPKVPTPSPPLQLMGRHAALLRKQRAVEKPVAEGRSKVEKAKAKVAEEQGRLAEVEAELAGVVEQIRVVREEIEKREKARREEAREPRCMEIEESEEEEEEDEEDQEKLECGKRRKVVRKGRFFRAGRSLDVDKLVRLLGSLSREHFACAPLVGACAPLGRFMQ